MTPAITDLQWQTLSPHPRLFASPARMASLAAQTDTVSQQMLALLRADAERKLTAPPVAYPKQGFMLFAMRDVQARVLTLALLYRLTGERRYFVRARQDLRELAALPNWGTGHFLDVGEACLTAGIGLDWLYDALSPDDRETLADAIISRALRPSLEVPDVPGSWLNGDFNWNQVCHAGLSMGAIAVAEQQPELSLFIVRRAAENIPTAGAVYAPDGSYPEGPSYWSYGTIFHILMIEALRGALQTSCGLETLPGFLQSSEFRLQMVTPTGGDFSFSDYHDEGFHEPHMLWFARERGLPELARRELAALAAREAARDTAADGPLKLSRHLPMGLLWWKPNLSAQHAELPRHWTASGHLPVAVMRSAWDDPRAAYLAIKGGTPNQSHGHMDVGSFIYEADGVRWALDLGTESYDRMREARLDLWNYTQHSSRWAAFRVGPEGHNIARFNGAPQNVNGKAEVRALPDDNGIMGNEVELSPLYPAVQSVRRTVRLLPDRSAAVEDEWETGQDDATYSFQWLTTARITTLPGGLRLEQGGEALHLLVEASAPWTVKIQNFSLPQAPQDSPNLSLSRIAFRLKTGPQATGFLKVKAVPLSQAPAPYGSPSVP